MDISSLGAICSVQKMAEALVVGPHSERECILFELQQLMGHCLGDNMKILIPVLCQHAPNWNIDLQIQVAQRLFNVVCPGARDIGHQHDNVRLARSHPSLQ